MRHVLLLSFATVLPLWGCGGDDDGPSCTEIPDPTLETLNQNVMARSCTISNSCHHGSGAEPIFDGPDGEDAHMDLSDPQDLCALIDRPAVSDAQHRPVITCGSCEDSYLMVKVDPARAGEITSSDELHEAYGDDIDATTMPQSSRGLAADPICQFKIDALCAWITADCPGC